MRMRYAIAYHVGVKKCSYTSFPLCFSSIRQLTNFFLSSLKKHRKRDGVPGFSTVFVP